MLDVTQAFYLGRGMTEHMETLVGLRMQESAQAECKARTLRLRDMPVESPGKLPCLQDPTARRIGAAKAAAKRAFKRLQA